MKTILLVDDIETVREQFAFDIHRKTGLEVITAENGREALEILDEREVDVVILDLEMPVMDGLQMLKVKDEEGPDDVPVIVYTAKGNFERCVRAVQLGAYNFFDKDEVSIDQLVRSIENALERRELLLENRSLRAATYPDSTLVGISSAMQELRDHLSKVAQVPSNVLILGESGTGKELVAHEIHRLSPRKPKPFVAVNCAAIPENLVESELFGFEKGAFSGAVRASKGKFEAANKGTVFLDEIGDMPSAIQAKLLRVLEEGEITRLGGEGKTIEVDVRVIAATHRDLESEIENGGFRKDLYFRICTHVVKVPPLRKRLEDVEPLTLFFVERICERFGISKKRIPQDTLAALQAYSWHQNNVRELENIVERMIIQCDGDALLPEHIPPDVRDSANTPSIDGTKNFQELRREAERSILVQALKKHDWHLTNTAKALGISSHSNLIKMMQRLDIKRPPKAN